MSVKQATTSRRAWQPAFLAMLACVLIWPQTAPAHHILGRPSYSLNEDSNTPSSMQGEMLIGDYSVTYMVFPAFPKPGAQGRINIYATRNTDGTPFDGEVQFLVRERSWLDWAGMVKRTEKMGAQVLDDGVHRQPFTFKAEGSYIVTARFEAGGEPYLIDIPLRVGAPPALGPIGITVAILTVLLVGVSVIQRRRTMTGKIRGAHDPAASARRPGQPPSDNGKHSG